MFQWIKKLFSRNERVTSKLIEFTNNNALGYSYRDIAAYELIDEGNNNHTLIVYYRGGGSFSKEFNATPEEIWQMKLDFAKYIFP